MSISFYTKSLDHVKKSKWRFIKIGLICIGELVLLTALLMLFAYHYGINTWDTLDTMEILYHLSTALSGVSGELTFRFIEYCVIPVILIMIAVNFLMFFYAKKKIAVEIRKSKTRHYYTVFSPQKIKRFFRVLLLPVSIFLFFYGYRLTSNIFDYQFAYQMLTYKPSSNNSSNDDELKSNDLSKPDSTSDKSFQTHEKNYTNINPDDIEYIEINVFDYDFRHPTRSFEFDDFIEENYIDPRTVDIRFPEEKRNLIYIFMESIETTYFSKAQGGDMPVNLMPEFIEIMDQNLFFSHNSLYGGGSQLTSRWTIAAIVAQTAGLPLMGLPERNARSADGTFLSGAYPLGSILEDNGYSNTFIMGSYASFAARDDYLSQHGNYRLFDLTLARELERIPTWYRVWWGFEDEKLYDWAKDEALELAKKDEPFNLTLLTVDTHHISGYVCRLCRDRHEEQLANVISCASRQVNNFITWLSEQDFYENTTIIIAGDHRSMDPHFFEETTWNYRRMIPYIIINPAVELIGTHERMFSTMDIFPTTLAALGVKIQGNRLGLGVNLFSDELTIIEHYSLDFVITELQKFSVFYMDTFW
ncbi:MAG: LTA synthase family protein [Oscillospiraceae bacterium]|jgi:phosphoglycerol transferase|nr:LTA synthase family protein [Oscillospiraceae bacterium]